MNTNSELRERMRNRRERWQIQQAGWFDAVGLVVPIAAPSVPAFLTATAIYHHYPALLGLSSIYVLMIAVIAGAVVEMLGMLSIETMFDMRTFNQTKREDEESAPFAYALGAVVFYLVLVILLVVLLKVFPSLALWSLIPLTVLGFITSWVMVLRKQHGDRVHRSESVHAEQSALTDAQARIEELNKLLDSVVADRDEWREKANKLRDEMNSLNATVQALRSQPLQQVVAKEGKTTAAAKRTSPVDRQVKKQLLLAFYTEHPGASIREAAEQIGCSTGSASTYANELVDEQLLNKDADGKYQPRIVVQLPGVQAVQLNGKH